jgi:Tfp pilus assembly protein PilF
MLLAHLVPRPSKRDGFSPRNRQVREGTQEGSMAANAQHEYAVYLFQQGYYEDVIRQLDEVLHEEETGERWSDWATAQFALSHYVEAERGFRRALDLDPDLVDAAVNFGTMLAGLRRWTEAIEMLERTLPKLQTDGRAAVGALIEQCQTQLASGALRPKAG